MASLFIKTKPIKSIAPDWYEKLLAAVAAALFVIVIVALAKGQAQWGDVGAVVWTHLGTILIALVLTPYMLLRPRGTKLHRRLGKIWVAAMTATAVISLLIRHSDQTYFSVIHILSVFVLIMAPRVWLTARKHDVAAHRGTVRGLVTGALIVAGYFTLLETRLLGHWLFG
jgi:uncharacterized membrane protein